MKSTRRESMATDAEAGERWADLGNAIASTYETLISLSNQNWARLIMFRGVAQAGLQYGGFPVARKVAEDIAAHEQALFPSEPERFSPGSHRANFLKSLLKMNEDQVGRAIDGAAIVFGHSILDYEATQFCHLCMLANPARSEDVLGGRKVELREAKTRPYPDLLSDAIKARTRDLADEALVKRVHFFFGYTAELPDPGDLDGFVPDLTRVEKFDELRNDLIHHGEFEKISSPIDHDLDFIQSMSRYFAVRFKHNFRNLLGDRAAAEGTSDGQAG